MGATGENEEDESRKQPVLGMHFGIHGVIDYNRYIATVGAGPATANLLWRNS